jgi:predicted transposase/invertase (TIGR01784 family)
MANEYDKILRETLKSPKYNLLKQLLQVEAISIKALPPKVQQTVLEWEADTVLEVVPVEGDPFILHIEWQSGNDSQMAYRMARYDLLLYGSYNRKVKGVVIYVGEKLMSMNNTFESFGLNYTCSMIDIRDISPEVFLASDDPGELILAILAGRNADGEVIRQILRKLHILTADDKAFFSEKVKHLELIAQLRGLKLQELLIKEEEIMPINIDIRKDLRFRQGMAQGRAQGVKEGEKLGVLEGKKHTALKLLEKGMPLSEIEEVTGFSASEIKEWQQSAKA